MDSEKLLHHKTDVMAKVIEEVIGAGCDGFDAAIEVQRALGILDTVLASGAAASDAVVETIRLWEDVFYEEENGG